MVFFCLFISGGLFNFVFISGGLFIFGVCMVPTGPGNREKSGNLTWVPPGPGKLWLFIKSGKSPGF